MSKGERENGPLTKTILNPLQVLWKDFAKGGQDSLSRPNSIHMSIVSLLL
jgi:hypothetical protein